MKSQEKSVVENTSYGYVWLASIPPFSGIRFSHHAPCLTALSLIPNMLQGAVCVCVRVCVCVFPRPGQWEYHILFGFQDWLPRLDTWPKPANQFQSEPVLRICLSDWQWVFTLFLLDMMLWIYQHGTTRGHLRDRVSWTLILAKKSTKLRGDKEPPSMMTSFAHTHSILDTQPVLHWSEALA